MGVIRATWRDLGYAQLAPSEYLTVAKVQKFAQQLPQVGYEVLEEPATIWIRRKERHRGFPSRPFLSKIAELSSSTYSQESFDFLDEWEKSGYMTQRTVGWEPLLLGELEELAGGADCTGKRAAKKWSHIASTLPLAYPEQLRVILKQTVLPAFFQKHPRGRLVVYQMNFDYEKLFTVLKVAYGTSQYGAFAPINATKVLSRWHSPAPMETSTRLLKILCLLCYPRIIGHVAMPLGLQFFFVQDKRINQTFPAFPVDWLHYFNSASEFGKQDVGSPERVLSEGTAEYKATVHRRFLWRRKVSAGDTSELLDWFVERINCLFFDIDDLTIHEKLGRKSGTKAIDAVFAFEHLLAIDRIIHRVLDISSSANVGDAKILLFEVADTWDTLYTQFGNTSEGVFFNTLFNPRKAVPLIADLLARLPGKWKTWMVDITKQIYQDLTDIIVKSVWMPGKHLPAEKKILVKDKELKNEEKENYDDFVAHLMRAYRNTHHGYFTFADKFLLRPSRYLALTDGNLPDSMTYLANLWLLAYLASPEEFIGCKTLRRDYD